MNLWRRFLGGFVTGPAFPDATTALCETPEPNYFAEVEATRRRDVDAFFDRKADECGGELA